MYILLIASDLEKLEINNDYKKRILKTSSGCSYQDDILTVYLHLE